MGKCAERVAGVMPVTRIGYNCKADDDDKDDNNDVCATIIIINGTLRVRAGG